ncbi:MAG: ABC transporter ATP-binding protein [Deltaproteobacteria bacterium]|nr:ABC transporter ATP-binding protein [Deltaproteobacteria bacterium]
MNDPLLKIQGLVAGYGGTPILQGVELTVHEAEIVAIIGRNGVGKSTLMKTIIGLLQTTAGTILYKGKAMSGLDAHERARLGIGYIPQGRGIFQRLTVAENLIMGHSINSLKKDKLSDLVDRYFPVLKNRSGQRAGTMSGGEQQQLAIGRALVGNPDLVLLDEPSEGIQPSIVHDIGQNMKRLNAEMGLTILFVEQNIDMIIAMAQRCYVMDKGRIIDEVLPGQLANDAVVRRCLAV